MASAASEAAVATPRGNARAAAPSAQRAATAAWLCAIPCAAVVALAILALGPPLGRLLFVPAPSTYTFLQEQLPVIRPEPTEEARYLIALAAPLLAALAIVLGPRWQPRLPARIADAGVAATQAVLAAVVIGSIVAQHRFVFRAAYTGGEDPFSIWYFKTPTFLLAGALAGAVTAAAASDRMHGSAAALLLCESTSRRWVVAAVALIATVVWVLPGVQTDASVGLITPNVFYHYQFPYDEAFAVLDGRTPLVNFTAQYGSLWPFVSALSMTVFGKTLLTFTVTMMAIGTLALLAVFGVLRRVTGSSVAALVLYLPVLASSLFLLGGTPEYRASVGNYLGTFPLRYAAPWFLAWLTARQLARREPPRAVSLWLLFTAAGLAVLNNGDFGMAAAGACVAAFLFGTPGNWTRASLLRLAGLLAAGLASALVLVSLLTLSRAGTLPRLGRLLDYPRLYALGGFALSPIPGVLGTHLLIYLTYVAGVVVATVRALRGATNRVLTGMLAWAGTFGLGAGTYYVGRSHPVALKHHFGAWSFTLALLTIVVVADVARRPSRRALASALVVLFGFGVMAGSVAQAPRPWGEVARVNSGRAPAETWGSSEPFVPSADPAARRFVGSLADGRSRFVYRRGAPVAVLLTEGHHVADAYGVVNVTPYTGVQSLQTVQRVEATLDALRDAGGNTVIVPGIPEPGLYAVLDRRGFEVVTGSGLSPWVEGHTTPLVQRWPIVGGVVKWVDTRHLHPRALE